MTGCVSINPSTIQNPNIEFSNGFETMGGMKVLALKGIEKQGHLWAVRYTRPHGRNVQDAIFLCDTPDAAKAKYRELLDVLLKQNGVYVQYRPA